MVKRCKQKDKNSDDGQCQNIAMHRYTWPGNKETFICDDHLPKLKQVAEALGFFLEIIPLKYDE